MQESDVFIQTSFEKSPEFTSIQVGGVKLAIHSSSPEIVTWSRSIFAAYGTSETVGSRLVFRILNSAQWRKAKSESPVRTSETGPERPFFMNCGDFMIARHDGDHLVLSEERPEHELRGFMSRVLARVLPHHGSILLHAAGIARNSKGYLFFGPRGAGKSTAVALIADADPEARILGDDVVIVQAPEWGRPVIHTAPIGCRYSRLAPPPMQIALDAAYSLVRDSQTKVEDVSPGAGLRLLREAAEPVSGEVLYDSALEESVQRILSRVARSSGMGVRQLRFERGMEFWKRVRS